MIYKSLPNYKASKVKEIIPWTVRRPKFKDKDDQINRLNDPKTRACLISAAVGVIEDSRINKENPARKLFGFIADIDAKKSVWPEGFPSSEIRRLIKRVPKPEHPTRVCRTISGGYRLIWEFDKPILVNSNVEAKQFLGNLAKKLSIKRRFEGYDVVSENPSQYFEVGGEWEEVGGKLSFEYLFRILRDLQELNAKEIIKFVPSIDEIREWAISVYKFEGQLDIGGRCPRFWVDDIEARSLTNECEIKERGIQVYAERYHGFHTWADIFPKQYVDYVKYNNERLLTHHAFDGHWYWVWDGKRWVDKSATVFQRYLIYEWKFSNRKKGGLSEVEYWMSKIETQCRVKAAAPFHYDKDFLVRFNGDTYANTSTIKCVEPESGDVKNTLKWFEGMFPKEALDSWFSHLKRLYVSAHEGQLLRGQACMLVGETGIGKTFLCTPWMLALMGCSASADAYLTGDSRFTGALGESAIWTGNDMWGTNFAQNNRTTDIIKQLVANEVHTLERKYREVTELPWRGRLFLSMNSDAMSLDNLPRAGTNALDKIHLFWLEPSAPQLLDSTANKILLEVPAFAQFLIDYEPPKALLTKDRFGMKTYADPRLMAEAMVRSPVFQFAQELKIVLMHRAKHYPDSKTWRATAYELARFAEDTGVFGVVLGRQSHLLQPRKSGQFLRQLAENPILMDQLGPKNSQKSAISTPNEPIIGQNRRLKHGVEYAFRLDF